MFLKGVSFKGVSFHFHGKSLFLCKRLISTAEVYFYEESVRISMKKVNLITQSAYHLYGKEEPMHGVDEFLCRNWVILKCEAVALVGHRIGELPLERDRKFLKNANSDKYD